MVNKHFGKITLWLGLALFAAWPHWVWLTKRMNDNSDEPWGMVALVTLVLLALRDRANFIQPNKATWVVSALLMLMATTVWGALPPIFATAFAVLGIIRLLTGMLPECRPRLPLFLLALLTLPLTASLNFYLGYPLRWFCAQTVAPILSVVGLSVTPQGTALWWNGKSVLVDAPCAGIAMLWLGLFLATTLSYLHSASSFRTLLNLLAALAVVMLANVLRNCLLFFKEAKIVQLPHWTHEAIGLLVFGLIVLSLYKICAHSGNRDIDHEIA